MKPSVQQACQGCAELLDRQRRIETLLEAVLQRLPDARDPHAVDQALKAAIDRAVGAAGFGAYELMAASAADAELRSALDDALVDDANQLGHVLRRLQKAGLVEMIGRDRRGRRWRLVRAD